jgi:hypothetical protein
MNKKLLYISFILLMLIPMSVNASDWTKTDTAVQLGYTALHVMDWGQTISIAKDKVKWYETNPILGRHPSQGRVNLYFASTLIGQAAIAYILPKEWRRTWQIAWIGIEASYVYKNYKVGIGVRF